MLQPRRKKLLRIFMHLFVVIVFSSYDFRNKMNLSLYRLSSIMNFSIQIWVYAIMLCKYKCNLLGKMSSFCLTTMRRGLCSIKAYSIHDAFIVGVKYVVYRNRSNWLWAQFLFWYVRFLSYPLSNQKSLSPGE